MTYDRSKTIGRVAFLAHCDVIRDLLEKGHRNKEVFAELEAKLTISYSQFNRYVLRYITGEQNNGHQRKRTAQISPPTPYPAPTPAPSGEARNSDAQVFKTGQKRAQFKHDPNSGNTRDDLI
ncbi:TraK family protein [Pseudomonas fragi]|uniref:Uncharacterized protein n=1 Tax=Pseudomonas fragi TaxID=296 RepID=A0A9Q6YD59_PSEFR|nr:TraK family protein [Pseudomonas fragi]QPL30865.1 hypothetical protein I5R27_18865 [Pseudomonas fragi]